MTLTRRRLVSASAAALAAGWIGLPGIALAAARTDRRYVFVILRGALDGLAAVAPYGDRAYAAVRRGLALPAPGAEGGLLALDGFFGLNPAMAALMPYWKAGDLAVFHAAASPYRERSHFDAQNALELGATRPHGYRDGWLNRMLSLFGAEGRSMGLAIGQSVPAVLAGAHPVASWSPSGGALPQDFLQRVGMMYARDPLFGTALKEAVDIHALADQELDGDFVGGGSAQGPEAIRGLAGAIGRLLAAPTGARIAVIEASGWDTHAGQGTVGGSLANRLGNLADGLAALAEALKPVWRDSTVTVATEFGRTVAMNGTNGSDHGTGSVALVMGGGINGGRVYADWPGLAPARLYQGRDLAPTFDLRRLWKSVATDHFGLPADAVNRVVFPDGGKVDGVRELFRS